MTQATMSVDSPSWGVTMMRIASLGNFFWARTKEEELSRNTIQNKILRRHTRIKDFPPSSEKEMALDLIH